MYKNTRRNKTKPKIAKKPDKEATTETLPHLFK